MESHNFECADYHTQNGPLSIAMSAMLDPGLNIKNQKLIVSRGAERLKNDPWIFHGVATPGGEQVTELADGNIDRPPQHFGFWRENLDPWFPP
jgi:hypothetical protein